MSEKLLIVDDEPEIREMLAEYFEWNGYTALTAENGVQALELAEQEPDLILLDVNLPGMDGLSVCEALRGHLSCPILFLTAKVEDGDKLRGFSAGGDDYVVKPFSLELLGARVEAHLRRERRARSSAKVRFSHGLAVDYFARTVTADGAPVTLAKKEYQILELLTQNPGQVFDRERIYERVWGYDSEGDSSVIPEHIRRLRQKLGEAGKQLETVWGVGYRWNR